MKKSIALLLLGAMATLGANAFTSGQFNYNIVGENEVEIARPTDTSAEGAYHDVVSFPESVTYGGKTYTVVGIGERAFQYAELSGPRMPSSYRYVAPWAFFQAEGVSVRIGANVDSIALGAFAGNKFTNFLCDTNNRKYSLIYPADVGEDETWVGGILVDINKETIIAFPGNKKDPNNSNLYLYTYKVPKRIKHIANHAFNRNPILKKVYFHDGVEDIGEYAFYGCENMTSVEIPGPTKLSYGSFAAIEFTLQQIILHEGVTEVPAYCFFDADPLTDLQLPSTLQLIGEGAFSHCANLTSVTFPENLLACDPQAFSNCAKLETVNVNDNCIFLGSNCFMNCTALTGMDLKNIQYLGSTAFNSCSSMRNVTAAALVETDRAPFYNCTSLESVTFPETLRKIGPVAFMKCRSLTNAVIPAGVEFVGDGFACGATALNAIQLADGNQNYVVVDGVLYDKAMTRLVSLPGTMAETDFTVPATVQEIGEQACRWTNLTKLNTGNVKIIGQTAFGESSALAEVTFGAACDSINDMAFSSCSAIVKVTSLKTTPPTGGVFVDGVYTAATLYVPRGSKEAYQAHENWGKFTTIEEIEVETPVLDRGDLNGDGNVDVTDVSMLIDVVLGKDVVLAEGAVVDLNDDGNIDVSDVSLLIDIVLGKAE